MLSRVCRSLFSSRVYSSWEIRFEPNPFRWHRLHSIAFALLLRPVIQWTKTENSGGKQHAWPRPGISWAHSGKRQGTSELCLLPLVFDRSIMEQPGNIVETYGTPKNTINTVRKCYLQFTCNEMWQMDTNGTANAGPFFPNVCCLDTTWEAGRVLQMPWMWQALWVKARHRVTTKWIFWTNSMCPCVNFGTNGSFDEFVDANIENVPMIHWTRYFLVTRKVRSSCRRVGVG